MLRGMRALVQTRVSNDPRADARSTEEQELECRAWADREGWTITKVITETGSASRYGRSTKARGRWAELTAELGSGDYDILLSWEASRATRELSVYTELRDLCAKTGVLWGYSGAVFDLTNRSDRFRTGLDALLSEDESHRISDRVQRSVRARAIQGHPHGKLPYGYRREYSEENGALLRQVPDEETAPIVREIFNRVDAGEALHAIAKDLTARGIPIPRPPRSPRRHDGLAWLDSSVRRIALNPTNAGMRVHRGEVVGAAKWPGLVTLEQFDRVRAILTDPTRSTRSGDSRARWLLSGIATCGRPECGGPLRVLNNRGTKTYTCTWCQKVTRRLEPVDAYVTERVIALLATWGLDDHEGDDVDDEVAALDVELEALRTRLDGFVDAAADGTVSPKALARIEARLRPQIRAFEEKRRRLIVPSPVAAVDLSDPARWWYRATLEEQRELVREVVTVEVLPAGRGRRIFDPSLVRVLPRH